MWRKLPADRVQPNMDRLTRRVLVVDDNRDSADSLAKLLGLWGYDARVSYSGAEAVEVAREFLPEVVVLDLAMPGMSGYEAARRLRQIPGLDATLFIALTGFDRVEEGHFQHHLVKPAAPDALRQLLGGPG
jgi:CheY-like chemotaxis protein